AILPKALLGGAAGAGGLSLLLGGVSLSSMLSAKKEVAGTERAADSDVIRRARRLGLVSDVLLVGALASGGADLYPTRLKNTPGQPEVAGLLSPAGIGISVRY